MDDYDWNVLSEAYDIAQARIEALERELAECKSAWEDSNAALGKAIVEVDEMRLIADLRQSQAELWKAQLAEERALCDRLADTLNKADEALHDDGCRTTMWPRPQIAAARTAYRNKRGEG